MTNWKKLFDSYVELRDEQACQKIPAKPGVVLITDESQIPIQMITAASMRARLLARLAEPVDPDSQKITRRANLSEIARLVFYTQTSSAFETDLAYLKLAPQIWPARYSKIIKTKPPWFVELDLQNAHPHFRRVRKLLQNSLSVGPFATAGDCEKFIDALADSFDLCRNLSCLKRYPNSKGCAYAEMHRCVNICAGAISMERYRELLRDAFNFAAGDRESFKSDLEARMKKSAADLNFELAGALKSRIDRLKFFEQENFRFVNSADEFKYIFVQPGAGKREFRAFAAKPGRAEFIGKFDWPDSSKCEKLLKSASDFFTSKASTDNFKSSIGQLQNGLVCEYLFSGDSKRGLLFHWQNNLTSAELYDAVFANRELLKLSMVEPKKNSSKSE